jgi:DNA invertase Pin-like site-specific DNA recombinase
MIDVGAWVRVSTGGQDEANQVSDIQRHCAEHGYRIAKWYELNDKSASKGEQQVKLDEMLGDMRLGVITVLVCWHSDRVERRGPEALFRLLRQAREAGGGIESTKEPLLGTDDLSGEAMTALGAIISRHYSVHLGEQVKLAHQRIKANGGLVAGGTPWGYVIAGEKYNKTIVPTDLCREIVPLIFQHCIDGDSCFTIAEWLDSIGVRPTRGEKWSQGSVHRIITNMTYAGRRQDEGTLKPNGLPSRKNRKTIMTCEAVITLDVWRRANEALRNRPQRGHGTAAKLPDRALLINLKCARCGAPMWRITAGRTGQQKRLYYRCYGQGPQRKGCGNMIRLERLDEMVIARMLVWHDQHYTIRTWVEGEDWQADIESIAQDIREIDPVEMALNPEITRRHTELMAQLADYTSREVIDGNWDEIDTGITKGMYFYDLNPEGRREYLKACDIRAEKAGCCGGIRVVIDGREDIAHKAGCEEDTDTP